MNVRLNLALHGLLLALAGCSDPGEANPEHGHEHGADEHDHAANENPSVGHAPHDDDDDHAAHGHAHDTPERPSEVVTHWGESTQLFVEFPALVVGRDSRFAAHLTGLVGHVAVDSGVVLVELSGGEFPVERFSVDGPSVPGIFRPVVRPLYGGTRNLAIRLTSDSHTETHDLGSFTVFASPRDAMTAAPEEPELEGQIGYLLEQQWRVSFAVEEVTERTMRPNIPAFASLVQPSDSVTVVTAPQDGRLVTAAGAPPVVGQSVGEGAVLFQMTTVPQGDGDPAGLDLAVEQSQIRVAAAQREVERLAPLLTQGVIPERRLDEARSELADAEAELRSANRRRSGFSQNQRVGGARDTLDVPAPINGTIAELFVSPGTWVSQGDPVARIVNTERLILSVGVPEAYVNRLQAISGAWFRPERAAAIVEVPGSSLISIATEIDDESRTLPVRFAIDNQAGQLFAGMRAPAHLVVDEPRQAAAVPLTSVIDDAGTDVVFVQTGGESFERRAVRLGIQDGDYIEIIEGVAPGEWVVAVGAYSVKLASTSTESIGHGHAH